MTNEPEALHPSGPDDPGLGGPDDPGRLGAAVRSATRIAARRPRTTIALWLLLIVGCTVLGSLAGTRSLTQSAAGTGESARAQARLTAAGLRDDAVENILVQSRSASRTATAAGMLERRAKALPGVLAGAGTRRLAVAVGGRRAHRARPGDAARRPRQRGRARRRARDGRRRGRARRARRHAPGGRPRLGRSRRHAGGQRGPPARRARLAAGHAAHPRARVRCARRGLGAAAARHHVGRGGARRPRPRVPDRAERQLDGAGRRAHRARGRRRLLAVLHPARARGAPRRARAARRARRRRGHRRARRAHRRADGDDRPLRAGVHGPRGVHLDGPRRDPRRGHRRGRIAHRAAGGARAARRSRRPRAPRPRAAARSQSEHRRDGARRRPPRPAPSAQRRDGARRRPPPPAPARARSAQRLDRARGRRHGSPPGRARQLAVRARRACRAGDDDAHRHSGQHRPARADAGGRGAACDRPLVPRRAGDRGYRRQRPGPRRTERSRRSALAR